MADSSALASGIGQCAGGQNKTDRADPCEKEEDGEGKPIPWRKICQHKTTRRGRKGRKPNGVQLGGQPKQSQLASHLPFSEPKYFVKLCRSKCRFPKYFQGVQKLSPHPLFPADDQPLLPCGGTGPGCCMGFHGGLSRQSAQTLPKKNLLCLQPGGRPPGPKAGPGRRIFLGEALNPLNGLRTLPLGSPGGRFPEQ